MIIQAAKKRLQIFFTFLILFSCFTKTEISSWNDASRMATVESLVKFHTFIIDNSSFFAATKDKYFYQNYFYSDKPPVLSLYTSVFYWCLNRLHISFDSYPALSYYLLTVSVIGVISSLGLVCLYEILNTFKINQNWSNIILLLAATGTLILPYSVVFNNHVLSGSLLLFSFYYLLPHSDIKRQYEGRQKNSFNVRSLIRFFSNSTRRVENSSTLNKQRLDAPAFYIQPYASEVKYAAISGFFITLAGSIDITMFLLIPLYSILLINKPLSAKIAFILSCVPMTIIYILLNIYTSGSIIPAAMNASLWNYPGSHFGESNLSGLVKQNIGSLKVYAFNMLLGSRGFISYTPIILFSIYGWMKMFFQPSFKYKKEYLFIAAVVIAFLLFYILRTNNYSGYSYGVRWFASIMLLACIPIAHVAEEVKKSKLFAGMFVAIAFVSIFISFIGLIAPFGGVPEVNYSSFFLGLERFNQQPLWVKAKLVLVLIVVYSVFYRLFEEFKKSQKRQSEKSALQERV